MSGHLRWPPERLRIVVAGRGGGKTHRLVKACVADENGWLVVPNEFHASWLLERYPELASERIIFPEQVRSGTLRGVRNAHLYVDDLDLLLSRLFSWNKVSMVTLSGENEAQLPVVNEREYARSQMTATGFYALAGVVPEKGGALEAALASTTSWIPRPERAGREGDSQPLPVVREGGAFVQDVVLEDLEVRAAVDEDGGELQDAVADDVEARKQLGIRRYGTALQTGNGRDMLLDAYEEALDLAIYLKGALEEGR